MFNLGDAAVEELLKVKTGYRIGSILAMSTLVFTGLKCHLQAVKVYITDLSTVFRGRRAETTFDETCLWCTPIFILLLVSIKLIRPVSRI
jgi:hypothetical protein